MEDLKQVISSAIVGAVATEITKRLLDALIKRVDRQKRPPKAASTSRGPKRNGASFERCPFPHIL